ncbi:2-Hydroxyacid oxidase 1-like [Glandiceps talaboti]
MNIILCIGVTVTLVLAIHLAIKWKKKQMMSKMMARHMKTGLFTLNEYEEHARRRLPKHKFDYFTDGAGNQSTQRENTTAFNRYRLRQRVLSNIKSPDLSTTLLGHTVDMPIGISPVLRKGWACSQGDLCSARAAGEHKICDIVPMYSESSMEKIAETNPHGLKWLQVYICKDRSKLEALIRRAEDAGYRALVVTVDCHWKRFVHSDWKNMIFKYLMKTRQGNFEGESFVKAYSQNVAEQASWDDIKHVTEKTTLPVILKGILTAEDAHLAVKYGAKAILVSNHGGRMMESLQPTLESLPEIVEAVGDKVEVYMDSGIRSGTDAIKALALGAKACFVGRPILYGLTYKGEDGAKQVLTLLREDLERVMQCTGCSSVADINRSILKDVHQQRYQGNLERKCKELQ